MNKTILTILIAAAVVLSGCSVELGHADHDHDGDGVQDHTEEEHQEHEEHEEHADEEELTPEEMHEQGIEH